MPLVQRPFFFFFNLKNFLFFWERFGNLEIFSFLIFFLNFFFKYIYEQSTSNATWIFRIQRNIKTWNKLTNFKLNHDVANQMWSGAKLGHLLLLGPLRMLKTWYAWTLIMIFLVFAWNSLCLHLKGKHLVSFWPLMLLMSSCTFDGLRC